VAVASRTPNSRPAHRTISDPRAIKALAHPARLAVLEELRVQPELTATEVAALVGLSPSAMSYHLRALEKWGFVERAEPGPDGRERPWRATSREGWTIEARSPVAAAAESALVAASFERMQASMQAWARAEPAEPQEWHAAATLSSSSVWITADEGAELIAEHQALLRRLRGRSGADRPAGSRRVRISLVVAPTPSP
jgi:DNA-binding transcriptional ArsR family regulator